MRSFTLLSALLPLATLAATARQHSTECTDVFTLTMESSNSSAEYNGLEIITDGALWTALPEYADGIYIGPAGGSPPVVHFFMNQTGTGNLYATGFTYNTSAWPDPGYNVFQPPFIVGEYLGGLAIYTHLPQVVCNEYLYCTTIQPAKVKKNGDYLEFVSAGGKYSGDTFDACLDGSPEVNYPGIWGLEVVPITDPAECQSVELKMTTVAPGVLDVC